MFSDFLQYVFLAVLHSFFQLFLHSKSTQCTGITIFKMEYGHWVEEQNRYILEMRTALSSNIDDIQLGKLVQSIMDHYTKLFSMKSAAAKADVFYVMSGMWMTTAERFFLWIGGFRPSELLKVMFVVLTFCYMYVTSNLFHMIWYSLTNKFLIFVLFLLSNGLIPWCFL